MKRILLLFTILFVSVITTACINNLAIQELNNKAESYLDKGDAQTAICRLKSSLDLDNEIYQTHYNLAVAYSSIGNYENALDELNKVLELKPEFADAYYTIAIAKESIAYKVVEKDTMAIGEDADTLTLDELSTFNTKASEAVEAFNQYLVKKANAPETEQVNAKISELNKKIKEYTDLYDKKKEKNSVEIEKEISTQEDNSELIQ